ncbi:MAG: ATP-dependent DNA helicase RecG, partial [Elainellaceae cyanobacterium]
MDWQRVQKALSIEAEQGFNDLVGRQCRFSEFLTRQLDQPPEALASGDQSRWQALSQQFTGYSELSFAQRRHLVAETRRVIHDAKRSLEERRSQPARQAAEKGSSVAERTATPPRTTPVDHRHQRSKLTLDQAVTYLPGIGPRNSERLGKLGLFTIRDLLFHYPRDYINYARQVPIQELVPGETVTVVGKVTRCTTFTSPRNPKLTIMEIRIRDRSGTLRLGRFFAGKRYSNRGWQEQQKRLYPSGATVAASGLVKENKYGLTLDDPQIEVIDHANGSIDSLSVGRVVPLYPLTEGVGADLLRKAVVAALPAAVQLQDALPEEIRQAQDLVPLPVAIAHIHFPPDDEVLQAARRRLVFDEFFYLQLGLLHRRREQTVVTTAVLTTKGSLLDQFYEVLPFSFTGAQARVVQEILNDLQQNVPMNRLVQGDVGSGKTVVAIAAILAAIQSEYQAAFMAPTEVLAEQHYRKLVEWFNSMHLPVELLTGSTRVAKRREIHSQLKTGELPLLVGTHALIEDPVQFQRLGLVVIDEQHRFGVAQRARLQQKGDNPHVLTMTATPIPRTLALTLHGDLDVSQIDELPPGRKPIQTTLLHGRDRPHAYDLMRREIAQGRQVYVVLPLVEESEKLDLKSAVDEHQHLREIFPEFAVGLLHGRLSSAEKDEVIQQFRKNETQILVSTTVVEVGVDVPNASIMLIEHAERFG